MQEGHAIVDVHDEAYAVIHLGILGTDIDVLRAKLCFYGGIKYELNILKVSSGFGGRDTQFPSLQQKSNFFSLPLGFQL